MFKSILNRLNQKLDNGETDMAKTRAIDFEYYQRANESIGQGYLTNSKNPDCFIKGVYPTHMLKGKGCHLYDQENNFCRICY